VGRVVGGRLGFPVGVIVGKDGRFEGEVDGILVKTNDGITLGRLDGDLVGFFDGPDVGRKEDKHEGILLGDSEGDFDDLTEGINDGKVVFASDGQLLDEVVGVFSGNFDGEIDEILLVGRVDGVAVGDEAVGFNVVSERAWPMKVKANSIAIDEEIILNFFLIEIPFSENRQQNKLPVFFKTATVFVQKEYS